ncbi:MAG: transposase [Puniceicoccales bacterium]|nr:transposase [Puniceicoccales bacterium]
MGEIIPRCSVETRASGPYGNWAFHKHRRTWEAIETADCSLIYLPPYSPDLKPIEKFWANLKGTLSNILHLFPSLFETIHSVCFSKVR